MKDTKETPEIGTQPQAEMQGAVLPGNSTAEIHSFAVPEPGWGQVLIRMKSSTICGSDIRAIYREHLGKGPEGYQGVIAGHEPCGQIVKTGPGCRGFAEGDRVIVYHISGCGLCNDCRRGYMISCTSEQYRRAYGWQRDGGMADYLLAEEKDLIHLPGALSYTDGAQVACGFGTAYEGLEKIGICGDDAVLITGLGPVGLAAAALCRKLGAQRIFGIDVSPDRLQLAGDLALCDEVIPSGPRNVSDLLARTAGRGVERASNAPGTPRRAPPPFVLPAAGGASYCSVKAARSSFSPPPISCMIRKRSMAPGSPPPGECRSWSSISCAGSSSRRPWSPTVFRLPGSMRPTL